jgi:pyruvate dehydrogenase (quinone)
MAGTVADFIAESLRTVGVKRVYGVVGDSLNGFTDALRRIGDIDWIHLQNPNFAAMAEAMGVKGIRVESPNHLRGALVEGFGHDGPALIEVVSARQELIMPPKTTFAEAREFGSFMLKAVMDGRAAELIDLAKANLLR